MLLQDTPTIEYKVGDRIIFVKREDLAVLKPVGLPPFLFPPPFAKVRGLYKVLLRVKDSPIPAVSYMDTSISMASWGISFFCYYLDLKAVVYFPRYKDGLRHETERHIKFCEGFGAEVRFLEMPNRQQINFYRARKQFMKDYPDGVMLPQGLPFDETVTEVEGQVMLLPENVLGGSLVISVGSGTMIAGVLKGLKKRRVLSQNVYGVLVAPKNILKKKKFVYSKAGVVDVGLFCDKLEKVNFIDAGYEYVQREECDVPFPCNSYYDRKAWQWLMNNIEKLKEPILFWNIGG